MNDDKLISITIVTNLFLFFMLFQVQEVVAQNLRICESGLEACERFISDKSKYKQCIIEQCSQEKTEIKSYFEITDKFEKIELIKSCDYGLRKCEALSEDKLMFWECVRDSCENQPVDYSPSCKAGQNLCVKESRSYNACISFSCPGDYQPNCSAGKRNCEKGLRKYWQCVYNTCLGSVSKYRQNIVQRKYIRVQDESGNITKIRIDKTPPVLAGVEEGHLNPPEGVSRQEWIRETPSEYLITGNPSSMLRCFRPYKQIRCDTDDIRSCICSDGSIPVFKKGPPQPIVIEEY